MRIRSGRPVWLVCAVLTLCQPAAAEIITVDPNAPTAQAKSPPPEASDTRLVQKVVYQTSGRTVASILDDLSKQTGVSLRAGYNASDWQVRDRRMSIFCNDLPLSNLMNSIARVMKFKWSKEKLKDGRWAYRLYMDRRTLLDADARKAREEERLAKLEAERRRKSLQSFADLASLSPEDAFRLRDTNPYKYFLATSGAAKSVSAFFTQTPAVVEALANGEQLTLGTDSLSTAGRRVLLQTMRELGAIESEDGHQPVLTGEDVTVNVNYDLASMRYFYEGSPAVLGEVELVQGDTSIHIELLDPDSSFAKTVGEMMIAQLEDGRPANEAEQQARDQLSLALVSDTNKDTPDGPLPARPDDPDLSRKVTVSPKSNQLPEIQRALAESSGFAVVSDSFVRTSGLPVSFAHEAELGELLDSVCEAFKYDWDKHGPVVEFRDKRWFAKRAAQIPQAWIEKWRKKFREAGVLELDDFAQIALLNEEQFKENIAEDELLRESGVPGVYRLLRGVMKLYGSFGAAERFALFTEDGVGLGMLNAEQSVLLRETLSFRNPQFLQRDPATLTLSAARLRFPQKTRYEFTITSNEDYEQIVMKMDAPRYEEPQNVSDRLK